MNSGVKQRGKSIKIIHPQSTFIIILSRRCVTERFVDYLEHYYYYLKWFSLFRQELAESKMSMSKVGRKMIDNSYQCQPINVI